MDPLIINLAPTGMVPTRAISPHVPLSAEEIADDCAQCVELGASMLHLHARDPEGKPTSKADQVGDLIATVRARCPDAILIATTSGRNVQDMAQRAACLMGEGAAKPDMASLTLSSLNFITGASINSPEAVMYLATVMRERGIRPELEVFDLGMVNFAKVLIEKGLLEPPYYFNILLGNVASAQATLLHLGTLVADLPPQSIWSVAGLGRYQACANALGVAVGRGVRTGLEDNVWLDEARTIPASNMQLVQRVVAQASAMGRSVAKPAQVRDWLQLQGPSND